MNRVFFWIIGIGAICLGAIIGHGSYEMTHSSLSFWFSAMFGVLGGISVVVPYLRKIGPQTQSPMVQSVEHRLDELERLKRRDMITPEEYAAKRQEILRDL